MRLCAEVGAAPTEPVDTACTVQPIRYGRGSAALIFAQQYAGPGHVSATLISTQEHTGRGGGGAVPLCLCRDVGTTTVQPAGAVSTVKLTRPGRGGAALISTQQDARPGGGGCALISTQQHDGPGGDNGTHFALRQKLTASAAGSGDAACNVQVPGSGGAAPLPLRRHWGGAAAGPAAAVCTQQHAAPGRCYTPVVSIQRHTGPGGGGAAHLPTRR